MPVPTYPALAGLTFPVQRSPMWSTLHQEAISGKDTPVQLWSYPRWKYELSYDLLRSDAVNLEWQTLAAFFNSVGGSAGVFQFADPDDGAVTAQALGTGDGVTTAFGMIRSLGGFTEPVFAPIVDGTLKFFDNAVDVTGHVTVGASGLATWDVAPITGHALTWTGSFKWLCRFDDDTTDFQKFMSSFWDARSVKFTTIKSNFA